MIAPNDRLSPRFVLEWTRERVRTRGIGGLVDFAISYSSDFLFDLRHGTSTNGWIPSTELKTSSRNLKYSERYQATKSRPFRKLIGHLRFPEGSVFVDIGCGKGKVLLLASGFGFKKVIGIEFSGELCQIARRNVDIYLRGRKVHADIEIIESDVLDYEIGAEDNVFYLYNSFSGVVLREFMANLARSVETSPRKVWLIYHIPTSRDVVDGFSLFSSATEHSVGGTDFVVYESD